MTTVSNEELGEWFKDFSAALPEVDTALLHELVENFRFDTLACFDLTEFQEALNVPGTRVVLRGVTKRTEIENLSMSGMFPELPSKSYEWNTAATALLVIKVGTMKGTMEFVTRISKQFRSEVPLDTMEFRGPVHDAPDIHDEAQLLLILSGIGNETFYRDHLGKTARERRLDKHC
jgi:hypothetical protein